MTLLLGARPAAPDPTAVALEVALRRLLTTGTCPAYVRAAATPWLASLTRPNAPRR